MWLEAKIPKVAARPININEMAYSYLNNIERHGCTSTSHRRVFVSFFLSFPFTFFRYVHASPPWAKQLQADLPAGTTVVTFTAWSPVSNYTSTCRIVIRVRGKSSGIREIRNKKNPLWDVERKMDLPCELLFLAPSIIAER